MKQREKKKRILVGAHVDEALWKAIKIWMAVDPERTVAVFIRDAIRRKLRADGVRVKEAA